MAESAAPRDVAQLVADHHQVLYRYAYRLAGSAADAEDLTQQVFMIAQQKLDQLRSAESARGWLFVILRNCYLKSRRQQLPLPTVSANFDINTIPDESFWEDGTYSHNGRYESNEPSVDGERLQHAIDELDDDFKLVVLLFYFEHRSYREIAETLDIPAGTVMSRLSRAKAHLRRRLCEPAAANCPTVVGDTTTGSATELNRPPLATMRRPTAIKG